MTSITRMLREERLRYAVKREIDRQSVAVEDDLINALVGHAMSNIEATYGDEEARIDASERAERSINPIIASLVNTSTSSFQDFLARTDVSEFPWTSSEF